MAEFFQEVKDGFCQKYFITSFQNMSNLVHGRIQFLPNVNQLIKNEILLTKNTYALKYLDESIVSPRVESARVVGQAEDITSIQEG